ncbi:hypothetical protein MP228_003617 [Amoeboaphelidium protococcarum]|nr:hypothetical protein MP228_003617 [Amoeboaphelidium protococcarum]
MVANTRHAVLLHPQCSHSSCWSKYCIPSLTGWRAVLKIPKLVLPPHSHRCRSIDSQASLAAPYHHLYVAPQSILIGATARVSILLLRLLIATGAVVQIHRYLWLVLYHHLHVAPQFIFIGVACKSHPPLLIATGTVVQIHRYLWLVLYHHLHVAPQFIFIGVACKSHPPLLIATGTVVQMHRYLWLALYHWLHVAPQSTFIGVTARVLLCFRSSYHLYYSHSFVASTVELLDIRLQISPFEVCQGVFVCSVVYSQELA